MSDRPLKLLLIDQDPIFRLGLRVALEAIPDLQITAVVESYTAALQILTEIAEQDPNQVNLVVLELGNGRSNTSQQLGLQFCRQLRALYPNLPIFLLSSIPEPGLLLAAKSIGVNGYSPKGTPVSELVITMQQVATGGFYWFDQTQTPNSSTDAINHVSTHSPLPLFKLRNNLRLSGIGYINATLARVTTQLQVPGIPVLDRAILAGQRRELLAARWLLNRLLVSAQERQQDKIIPIADRPPVSPPLSGGIQQTQIPPPLLTTAALQSALFASCITKLQFPLENVTDTTLEIDILFRVSS